MKKIISIEFVLCFLVFGFTITANASLVAHWSFDEAGGSIAHDSVGSVNGVLVGGATFNPSGVVGGAIQITDGYVNMANSFASTPTFSVQTWIKTKPGDTSPMTPLAKHWAGWGNGYYLSVNDVGDGYTYPNLAGFRSMDNATYSPTATGGPAVNDGAWHQLVGVYNVGISSLYVDGSFVVSTPNAYSDSDVDLVVGGLAYFDGNPVSMFHGLIDEVRIYDHALSRNEISSLYESTINPVPIPATAWLLVSGLIGLVGARKKLFG